MHVRKESRSSRQLALFLEESGYAKLSEDTQIHRTQLWRYASGRGKPAADQMATLHRVTGGRVAADGWETLAVDSVSVAKKVRRVAGDRAR